MSSFIAPVSPYRTISAQDVDLDLACTAQDIWDMVVRIPNWNRVLGATFLRRLFEISPRMRELYGFAGKNLEGDDFVKKGAAILVAVDNAVSCIGPDLSVLEQEMFALGRRHADNGAEPEFGPLFGDALLHTLKTGLGANFTEFDEEAWTAMYEHMASWVVQGLIAQTKDRHETLHAIKEDWRWESSSIEEDMPALLEASSVSSRISTSMSIQARRRSSTCSGHRSSISSYKSCTEWNHIELEENIYERVVANDLDFTTVQLVFDTWDHLVLKPTWEVDSAKFVMRRLFDLLPELKTAWGFPQDFDPDNLSHPHYRRFVQKGVGLMSGVARTIRGMGPDLEPMERDLKDLGRIHYLHMHAQPQFWPPVGEAIIDTLEYILEPEIFTEETKEAWGLVYHFMSYWMIEGLLAEKRGQ